MRDFRMHYHEMDQEYKQKYSKLAETQWNININLQYQQTPDQDQISTCLYSVQEKLAKTPRCSLATFKLLCSVVGKGTKRQGAGGRCALRGAGLPFSMMARSEANDLACYTNDFMQGLWYLGNQLWNGRSNASIGATFLYLQWNNIAFLN